MFELKIFESEQFGLIRTMVDDKTLEVVFNGNDVASALGYTKAANAIRDYCKGVIDLVTPTNTASDPQDGRLHPSHRTGR